VNTLVFNKPIGIDYPIDDQKSSILRSTFTTFDNERAKIINLIRTNRNERPMNPQFGLNLLTYIFEPVTEDTVLRIRIEIENAIQKYLPNIRVNEISVDLKELENKTYIIIELNFSVANIPDYYDIIKLVVGDDINGIV